MPQEIYEAYELYKTSIQIKDLQSLILFTATFYIPWIISWNYFVMNDHPDGYKRILFREVRVKWWKNFDIQKANKAAVSTLLESFHIS